MKHVIEAGHKSRIDRQTIEMSNAMALAVGEERLVNVVNVVNGVNGEVVHNQ